MGIRYRQKQEIDTLFGIIAEGVGWPRKDDGTMGDATYIDIGDGITIWATKPHYDTKDNYIKLEIHVATEAEDADAWAQRHEKED